MLLVNSDGTEAHSNEYEIKLNKTQLLFYVRRLVWTSYRMDWDSLWLSRMYRSQACSDRLVSKGFCDSHGMSCLQARSKGLANKGFFDFFLNSSFKRACEVIRTPLVDTDLNTCICSNHPRNKLSCTLIYTRLINIVFISFVLIRYKNFYRIRLTGLFLGQY